MIPIALMTSLLPMAIKLGAKLLPERAAAVVQKGIDVIASGVGPIETALNVIKHVAGVTGTAMQRGPDISEDELHKSLAAMNATVDDANAWADELRRRQQEPQPGT